MEWATEGWCPQRRRGGCGGKHPEGDVGTPAETERCGHAPGNSKDCGHRELQMQGRDLPSPPEPSEGAGPCA